jgi:RimJ/RimL family protein N-acetyltransferase
VQTPPIQTEHMIELETDRLLLRQWCDTDLEPFAALNADPKVMEFFPSVLTRAESDAAVQRVRSQIAERGWGFWATECKASGEFIGFIGLHAPTDLPFSPCVEVGWRLGHRFWGKGYATEGARAALHALFHTINEDEVLSFTAVGNLRSRAVMTRLGMRDAGLFDHPRVPEGSSLRRHCLYRLTAQEYRAQQGPSPLSAGRA